MTKHQLQDLFLRAPKGAEFVGISSLSGEPVYYRDIKEEGHYCCGSKGFDRGVWMYLPGIPSASPLYAMPSISNYIFSDRWRWSSMAWKVAENAVPADFAGTVKPWTGEGLPPVGAVCERNITRSAWCTTTILASSSDGSHVAYQDSSGKLGWSPHAESFRPIRTPEQIAADHRLHEIRNAHSAIAETLKQYVRDIHGGAVARTVIEAMIDADYRKHGEVVESIEAAGLKVKP